MNITSNKPVLRYGGKTLPLYDAVIPRIGASITHYGLAVLRQFEMQGVFPLNESVAIGRSRDKLRALQLLAREGVGLPVTAFAHGPRKAEDVVNEVGGAPVVIKLLEGTQGMGVILAETDSLGQVDHRGVHARPTSISSCRSTSARPPARMCARWWSATRSSPPCSARAKTGEFRSNLHRGGTAEAVELTPEEIAHGAQVGRDARPQRLPASTCCARSAGRW